MHDQRIVIRMRRGRLARILQAKLEGGDPSGAACILPQAACEQGLLNLTSLRDGCAPDPSALNSSGVAVSSVTSRCKSVNCSSGVVGYREVSLVDSQDCRHTGLVRIMLSI